MMIVMSVHHLNHHPHHGAHHHHLLRRHPYLYLRFKCPFRPDLRCRKCVDISTVLIIIFFVIVLIIVMTAGHAEDAS